MALLDCTAPRRVNAQAIILRDARSEGGGKTRLEALLQLRSERMQCMPGHLAAIGGCRSACDPDSRATALREVREESGLQGGIVLPPAKFAEGGKCDWYVIKVRAPTFAKPETSFECGDIDSVLPLLPTSSSAAECYGHAWVPVDDLSEIDSRLPLMGGLVGKVRAAVEHLQRVAGQFESERYLDSQFFEAQLRSSDIQVSADGEIVSCPTDQLHSAASAPGHLGVNLGSLRSQLEYYLSDENLRQDRFFHEKISADAEGWLSLQYIMGCKRVQAMQATQEDVVAALQASDIEVREDLAAIRRPAGWPLPPLEERQGKGGSTFRGRGYGNRGFSKATQKGEGRGGRSVGK